MTSVWTNLLQNLGVWQGSFADVTPAGCITADRPSLVTLQGRNDNQSIHQTVQVWSPDSGALERNLDLEYSSLNRGTTVLTTGAFSQGSMQWGPFSEFGAELGLIAGDRRLRVIPLFDRDSQLSRITLIRECRQGSTATERPLLTVQALVGQWHGLAETAYANWQPSTSARTTSKVSLNGTTVCWQSDVPLCDWSAEPDGNRLYYSVTDTFHQVVLLPDGAYCKTPITIPRRQAFELEIGWAIAPDRRQRMIRAYDGFGAWVSVTLVTESKT